MNCPNLVGRVFGRITVVSLSHSDRGKRFWRCRCACGAEKITRTQYLMAGKVQSCGCLRRDVTRRRVTTHGATAAATRRREYGIWNGMNQRCTNPNIDRFSCYGGRGIHVCEEWRTSFERFFADLGPSPSRTHSLERIDNDGHYEPGNVRWATKTEQSRNTRRNVPLTLNGETLLLTEWAKRLGTGHKTLSGRLDVLGWSVEKALTTPVDRSAGRFTSRTSVNG